MKLRCGTHSFGNFAQMYLCNIGVQLHFIIDDMQFKYKM